MMKQALYKVIKNIRQKYGYDFSQYHESYLLKHLKKFAEGQGYNSFDKLSINQEVLEVFFNHSSYFFRNPDVFLGLKKTIFPKLKLLPEIKIWHVGCSRGEEVYSLSMLLREEGLLEKVKIYASDLNKDILEKAKERAYVKHLLNIHKKNYQEAKGNKNFEDYIEKIDETHFILKDFVNIQFVQHDILKDKRIDNFHLILCRNMLIYFQSNAYKKALDLIYDSLLQKGFLCLGVAESAFPYIKDISIFNAKYNLYQK